MSYNSPLIRQSKIALKETPTLKLRLTPIMTVTQVCIPVNLRQETAMPHFVLAVRKFLSDALSLCAEFKLANCACVSRWSCLMNLDLLSLFGWFRVT